MVGFVGRVAGSYLATWGIMSSSQAKYLWNYFYWLLEPVVGVSQGKSFISDAIN